MKSDIIYSPVITEKTSALAQNNVFVFKVAKNANKIQILFKLVLPSNVGNIFNIIKINIGLSWIGVIVGEFLVSRSGIGYLVISS